MNTAVFQKYLFIFKNDFASSVILMMDIIIEAHELYRKKNGEDFNV